MTTNKQLQKTFKEYLEGGNIGWYLARMFYSQNGGFARRTGDNQRAIGFTQKKGAVVIDYIKLTQNQEQESGYDAEIEDSIELSVQTVEEHGKLTYLIDHAFQTTQEKQVSDPDHQDSMIN